MIILLINEVTVCYNNYFVIILDITSILNETPTQYELFELLSDINDKWYEIGLSLQVHRDILDDLKHSQKTNLIKLHAVIDKFLTTQPSPVTWVTVISAIESPVVNDKNIADLIHQYLSTGKSNMLLSNEVINSGVDNVPLKCINLA